MKKALMSLLIATGTAVSSVASSPAVKPESGDDAAFRHRAEVSHKNADLNHCLRIKAKVQFGEQFEITFKSKLASKSDANQSPRFFDDADFWPRWIELEGKKHPESLASLGAVVLRRMLQECIEENEMRNTVEQKQ